MNEQKLKELRALFSLSRDAVLCVRDRIIVFANTAAEERFPGCVGQAAENWLPPIIFDGTEDSWICTLPGEDGAISVSCVRQGDCLLLSLPRPDRPRTVIPTAALSELRTTTYNLHMAAELMLGRCSDDERLGTYASVLQHNYYRLLRLTRNLADANTLLEGELSVQRQSLNLRVLCESLIDSVRHFIRSRQVTLHFSHEGSCFLLQGDRERLEQLLLNLIANALASTEKGGEIRVNLSSRGHQLILSVDDTGRGMSESDLSSLFTVRETPSLLNSGAGLGLYISQGIVRSHHGSMLIESRPDRGTKVRIMLPASHDITFRDGNDLPCGAGLILRELSPILGHESYDKRYRD